METFYAYAFVGMSLVAAFLLILLDNALTTISNQRFFYNRARLRLKQLEQEKYTRMNN